MSTKKEKKNESKKLILKRLGGKGGNTMNVSSIDMTLK